MVVPDAANLQFLVFWIAEGAGYFEEQGITIDVRAPEAPALTQSLFQSGSAPFAVLPAPDFERLVAEDYAFELVANLLANDPIDLVLRTDVAETHGVRASETLAQRLQHMAGVTIGLAPNPRTRLEALFRSQGLEATNLVHLVALRGDEQNDAFTSGEVDALYTHTPYLERAILEGKGVVVADQARGEVPALAGRQIHALVVKRAFAVREPRVVDGMLRAIARAEALVHARPQAATDAILRVVTKYDRVHVAKLVELYAAAVPATPDVSAPKILKELAFYPAGGAAPDLSKVDLGRFVYRQASPPRGTSQRHRAFLAFLGVLALLAGISAALVDLRKSALRDARDTSV